jgi:predicted anti-sigma-YlaC factor YlaD
MDCKMAKALIPCAADNSLDEPYISRLMSHLASCEHCRVLFDAHNSIIREFEDANQVIAYSFSLPDDFSDDVLTSIQSHQSRFRSIRYCLYNWILNTYLLFTSSRKAIAFGVSVAILISIALVSTVSSRIMISSPVAIARVNSGHLISFSVKPRPDGSVIARVNSRRYCQITRSQEEALR